MSRRSVALAPEEPLDRVVIERAGERWRVERSRASTGETFIADDLVDAFEIVSAAYRPDGSPRPWPRSRSGGAE